MKLPRRNFLYLAASAAALSATSRIARAQAYPTRPVRWIVGFAPAGGNDIVARLMGQRASSACPKSRSAPTRRADTSGAVPCAPIDPETA
jgi:tripartite-type tricarboxylate transporter receptor subunit TctC